MRVVALLQMHRAHICNPPPVPATGSAETFCWDVAFFSVCIFNRKISSRSTVGLAAMHDFERLWSVEKFQLRDKQPKPGQNEAKLGRQVKHIAVDD